MKKLFLFIISITAYVYVQAQISYVTIERTPCFGACPTYTLSIDKNGNLTFIGSNHVSKIGSYKGKVSKKEANDFFRKYNVYINSKLKNEYKDDIVDVAGLNITIVKAGKKKYIKNAQYGPSILKAMANELDRISENSKWYDSRTKELFIEKIVEPAISDIYIAPENPATFPGGESAMKKFIQNEMRYPEIAKNQGREAKIVCKFIVDMEGNIMAPEVLQGAGFGFDDEAIRIISIMPQWIAAVQNGKNVKSEVVLPIFFKLK